MKSVKVHGDAPETDAYSKKCFCTVQNQVKRHCHDDTTKRRHCLAKKKIIHPDKLLKAAYVKRIRSGDRIKDDKVRPIRPPAFVLC